MLSWPAVLVLLCFGVAVDPVFADGPAREAEVRSLRFLGNRALPPMNSLVEGKPVGLVVDLAEAIAGRMASPVAIELIDWSEAQELVLAGEADALLQINPNPDRLKLFDFSDPLLLSEFSIFIAAERVGVATLRDLHGLRVGVEERGLPVALLKEHPAVRAVIIPDIPSGFSMLAAGTIEAVIVDRRVGSYVLAEQRIGGIRIVEEPVSTCLSAIAVNKDNAPLLAEINSALAEIRRDGTYDALIDRWRAQEVVFKTRQQVNRVNWSLAVVSAALLVSLVGLLLLGREVRRRLAIEKALEASEHRFQLAIESSGLALWDWDLVNKRVDFSPRWFFLRGRSPEGASDYEDEWRKGVHPDDWPRGVAALQRHFARETEVFFDEYRVMHADGNWRWIRDSGLAQRDARGEVVRMVGVEEEITERKEAELSLEASRARFRRLVEISLVGVWTTDTQGSNTYVSPRWSEITGIPPEKAAGSGWVRGVHPEDREKILEEWRQASLEKRPYISRFRFLHPAGRVVFVLCQALYVEDSDGMIGEWVGTILDMTERSGAAGQPGPADGALTRGNLPHGGEVKTNLTL